MSLASGESLINNFLPLSLAAPAASRGLARGQAPAPGISLLPKPHPSASSSSSALLGSEEALTTITGAMGDPWVRELLHLWIRGWLLEKLLFGTA